MLVALLSVTALFGAHAVSADLVSLQKSALRLWGILDETDHAAPTDYGPGPGRGRAAAPAGEAASAGQAAPASVEELAASAAAAIPSGAATANTTGVFGAPITWPIIPIHTVLLPDGRIMDYGSDESGNQGAQLYYDLWTPSLGTGSTSHVVLANTTGSDIFCSAQSVMTNGSVLISGGDLTVNGVRNSARNSTNLFSPAANSLTANTPMHYARWYGSLVSLADGELAIFGGYQNVGALSPVVPAPTPERYNIAAQSWTPLTGATNSAAFGENWYYPRSFVAPGGNIFVLSNDGTMYTVSTSGAGSTTQYALTAPPGSVDLPTIPFAPGKVLSLRSNRENVVVDYTGAVPVVTPTDSMDQVRLWANGTVMADGKVLINGGSTVENELTGVAYTAQLWDPSTGRFTAGAVAKKPRLYHSNAILLPDASVLTGGGGAPGPVNNLNAEIYYPPYLYSTNGAPATRPTLVSATPQFSNPGGTITATVGATDTISKLTFIRTGSTTHSYNSDQRFLDLPFTQTGQTLTAVLPSDPTILIPGYYMLFAFNTAGVPSVATILNVKVAMLTLPENWILAANACVSLPDPSNAANPIRLCMQSDANLVIYQGTAAPWSSNTWNAAPCSLQKCFAIFQGDGNFVLYDDNDKPYWATATDTRGQQLDLNASAPYLVITNAAGTPIWTSGP